MFHVKNNIIGPRIKKARQNHKPRITQADLATRLQLEGCNLSRTGIAKIELGLRQITDIEVTKFARILGVSIKWLFSDED
jgi:transcriptional regulator with XRE-family HTH domain